MCRLIAATADKQDPDESKFYFVRKLASNRPLDDRINDVRSPNPNSCLQAKLKQWRCHEAGIQIEVRARACSQRSY